MRADRSAPYAEFLASADVVTWRRSMNELARGVTGEAAAAGDAPASRVDVETLERALLVAAYVEWLARESGDVGVQAAAQECRGALRAVLVEQSRQLGRAGLRRCWAVDVAYNGYGTLATPDLQRDGQLAPEHQLLVLPSDHARRVALLQPLCRGERSSTFLPVVHFLGVSLLRLGAVQEALDLVADGWPQEHPLILDIVADGYERLGRWEKAVEAYRGSSWPGHRYRAALIGALARRPGASPEPLVLDEGMRRVLANRGGEMSQTELAGCIGFFDACTWNRADDWVVECELGSLSSRRCWFSDAELHLARALAVAPEAARFPLAAVRFSNLTWLTVPERQNGSAEIRVDLTPEAVQAGDEALASAWQDDDTAWIRVWVANRTRDVAVLPESMDSWPPSLRAQGYDALGDEARAVDARIAAVAEQYDHRVVGALFARALDAGLRGTARLLVGLVRQESGDDFFALWETADSLRRLDVPVAADAQVVGEVLSTDLLSGLLQLGRADVKNALRAYPVFLAVGQAGLADELLTLATQLAEGVSELVEVAALRRGAGFGDVAPADVDADGLACLARAQAQARDPLQRLQVARELFHYGRLADARRILESERVLPPGRMLSPAESVAVLQCGEWLTPGEREAILNAAVRRLDADHRAGALGLHPVEFGIRLLRAAEACEVRLGEWVRAGLAPALVDRSVPRHSVVDDLVEDVPAPDEADARRAGGLGSSVWSSVRDSLQAELTRDGIAAFRSIAAGAARNPSFGFRLALLRWLRSELRAQVCVARATRPAVPLDEVPASREDRTGNRAGLRAFELGEAWRRRLGDSGGRSDARARLRQLLAEEKDLEARWEWRRREAVGATWRRIELVLDVLTESVVGLVTPAELDHTNPLLAAVFTQVAADARALVTELGLERQLLGAQFGPAPGPGVKGIAS